jgi:hypothetical protein
MINSQRAFFGRARFNGLSIQPNIIPYSLSITLTSLLCSDHLPVDALLCLHTSAQCNFQRSTLMKDGRRDDDCVGVLTMVKVMTTKSYQNTSCRLHTTVAPFVRKNLPCSLPALFIPLCCPGDEGLHFILGRLGERPSSFGDNRNKGQTICFVMCIFGDTVEQVNSLANAVWFAKYWCQTRFMLVTNLPNLPSPGWTKIVQQAPGTRAGNFQISSSKNHIIQPRAGSQVFGMEARSACSGLR